ncbi:hypothetical protein H4Q32_025360 [Labeo rohita]|uniref:Reverse transcriptase domain-containing protein n=1 Tax=Labeo rohita TaxID=84645 RepID=A0ABQ8L6I5_LABRO|nr:hypothetical protein H4Q32_025360 [Labeo rohita]
MFKQAATYNNTTDLQEYAETVTAYINKCTEDVTVTKTITVRVNQKPWMTGEVYRLLKARNVAFRAGDEASLKTARPNLSRGIREAKRHTMSLLNKLNTFFARFEVQNTTTAQKTPPPPGDQVITLSPDNIFNISLNQAVVPTCFKATTIIPVPKKSSPSCFNDYRPVALTPILMKCFERLVMQRIKTVLPPSLDPFQFAYRPNRSTDDAISTLTQKLVQLGLNTSLCNWLLDFLTRRPQVVRVGSNTFSTIILNTGTPQGCVLSPLLFTLPTHDCTPSHSSNLFIKFADDTTVVGLISKRDETDYRSEVSRLAVWCRDNNLSLNVEKTKEIIVDFRRAHTQHAPLTINGASVERVSSTKFLGVHITEDLSWTNNTTALAKKLHLLQRHHREHPDELHHCVLLQPAAIREETAESPGQDQQTEGQLHPSGCQEAKLSPGSAPTPFFCPTNFLYCDTHQAVRKLNSLPALPPLPSSAPRTS